MLVKYSEEQGKEIISFVREIMECYIYKKSLPLMDQLYFKQARGVCISIKKEEKLRGFSIINDLNLSLKESVIKAVISIAAGNLVFVPLIGEELKEIRIELSLLTFPSEVDSSLKNFELGKDGLIVEYLTYKGLLMPQELNKENLSKIDFLEAVCMKAKIPKDSWQNKNIKFYRFQVQTFCEE